MENIWPCSTTTPLRFPFFLRTHFCALDTDSVFTLPRQKNVMENYEPVISYVFISIKREQSGTESTKNDKKHFVANGNDNTRPRARAFEEKHFNLSHIKHFHFSNDG